MRDSLLFWMEKEGSAVSTIAADFGSGRQSLSTPSSVSSAASGSPRLCVSQSPNCFTFLAGKATSIYSLKRISSNGHRESQSEKVFHYLLARGSLGATANEIARDLGLFPGRVTARLGDLRKVLLPCDQPLIVTNGTVVDEFSGMDNVVWVVNPVFHRPSEVLFYDEGVI